MKNTPGQNYTRTGWMAVTALVAVLVLVSFIPPQNIWGVSLRRANILGDLISFGEGAASGAQSAVFNEAEFRVDMEKVAEQIGAEAQAPQVQNTFEWSLPRKNAPYKEIVPNQQVQNPVLIPIEDFSDNGQMKAFYKLLLESKRPVRIAFMGDSFIEGDILTADLRELLQTAFGGTPRGGTGFAPMASPLTAFRRTVKTQSKGWSSYNIMQRKTAPQSLRDNFFISGWVCQPSEGASTRWENTYARKWLDSCSMARVFFISPSDSRVEVILNDTARHEFAIPGDASVRQVAVSAPHVHSLSFRVLSGTQGFIGYGGVFEGSGVVVDNYSIRSNNGQAMFWTNPSVNAQINAMLNYDLVILQYGLNIMQQGIRVYNNYGQQIEKMVTYVRECFPGAAVLVLGVSDRSVRTDQGLQTMDAVPHMLECQRRAAQNTKTAFWSTYDAMRSMGGMENFVASGWAGKDFTHINYAGGRKIAGALFDAMNSGVQKVYKSRNPLERPNGILDTTQVRKFEQRVLQSAPSWSDKTSGE